MESLTNRLVQQRSRSWKQAIGQWCLMGIVAYLGILLVLSWLENKLIYVPSPAGPNTYHGLDYDYEDVWFAAADGTKLHGWYIEHAQPRATVLYLHGNAGNIGHRADLIRNLSSRHRLNVFLFDYRGYGRSQGSPHEAGVLQDARAARAWVAERAKISEQDIVLFGQSLGGGVAVDLAQEGARGMVLLKTFTSLPDVAAGLYPFLPVHWVMRNRMQSIDKIAKYQGPLLIAHGDADRMIPFYHGEQLYEAANQPKRFVRLEGHGHNGIWPERFHQELETFLDELP